jgi:sigma-E factor negative regulatory protein RseC
MIEETGVVLAVRGPLAEVVSQRRGACGACSVNGACGTSLLERFFGRKQLILTVRNPVEAKPGDPVVVGIPEDALLQASAAAYLVPLLTMLAGGIGGAHVAGLLAPGLIDGLSVLGGGVGMGTGLWWLSRFSRSRGRDDRYQAVILRREVSGATSVTLSPPDRKASGRGGGEA